MLNNALAQTGWGGPTLTEANWREIVGDTVRRLPWRDVLNDARPFLERTDDIAMLTQENVLRLLERSEA